MTAREPVPRLTLRVDALTLVLFAAFVATLVLYVLAEKRIDRANDRRHLSLMLAYELRDSSEELTRSARTYAVTGERAWKQRFDEILEVRDGRRVRGPDSGMLRSLAPAGPDATALGLGRSVALLQLMRDAGFSDAEFALVASAKARSDALARTEREAMALAETGAAADRERAIAMLHDASYHAAKAGIMAPIDEFIAMAEARTRAAVDAAVLGATAWRIALAGVGLALLASLWRGRRQLQAALGGPVDEVRHRIMRLGGGDFAGPVVAASASPGSVLAWLEETRLKLAALESDRRQAQQTQQRLNRTLHMLGRCNLVLGEATDEAGYLEAVCRGIVDGADYRLAWIGYAENDPGKSMRVLAQAGEGADFLDALRVSWDAGSPLAPGPVARAVASGVTQVVDDIGALTEGGPWREEARRRGLRAGIVLPLRGTQGVFGALNLHAGEPGVFDAQQVELLEELARNVANGVESLRLRAQRDRAQSSASAKSTFLAHMSHEIRTPLNAVVGLAELGEIQARGTPMEPTLHALQQAGEHLLRVVNDILDFSRLEAGKLSVEHEPFALEVALSMVVGIGRAQADAKGLAFRVDAMAELPAWVVGDAHRLRQVLINLVSNAVKFTERGSVRLSVSHDGQTAVFAVADTGIGMSADQQERLFQPFEQGDASTTRRFGGSGLGLAISHNLARLMGGTIEARSVEGAGSTFTLRLPLPACEMPGRAEVPAERSAAAGAVSSAGAAARPRRLDGWRLLVAEDVEVNRMVIGAFLEREGAEVTFAEHGLQVIGRIVERGSEGFDAVLMDVQMPVLDGLETTRRLRRIAPRLPVIGVTAHALPHEHARCLEAGMVDQITKPIRIDDLVAALRRGVRRGVAGAPV